MKTVVYTTENGVFEFNLQDAIDRLHFYASEYKVDDPIEILDFLKQSREDPINIPPEKDYFGYIILDLLKERKGSVFCKTCQTSYSPDQLKSVLTGHGESPFSVTIERRIGFFRRIFKGRQRLPGMHGGKGYECPQGHELISMITWKT